LRDAENRGFDVHTELPMLVTGRSFDDAEDFTSVLHHRIGRYVTGAGYPSLPASEFVAGIFPRPSGIINSDILLALNDRAHAIERRARELATMAIERGDTWVREFGETPSTGELYERWVTEVAVGAAYLDRWGVNNPYTVLDGTTVSHEQETQRSRVLSAVQRVHAFTVAEAVLAKTAYVFSGDDLLEPPSQDFELHL
jgi:hypothetical protein